MRSKLSDCVCLRVGTKVERRSAGFDTLVEVSKFQVAGLGGVCVPFHPSTHPPTHINTHTHTHTPTRPHAHTRTDPQTDRQIDRQTDRQIDRQTHTHTPTENLRVSGSARNPKLWPSHAGEITTASEGKARKTKRRHDDWLVADQCCRATAMFSRVACFLG